MRLPRPKFPLGKPTWPTPVARPPVESETGVDYDTAWARKWPARVARAVIVDDLLRPVAHLLARPEVTGLDRLDDLDGPVIFVANHNSHLDTTLLLATIPERWRHKAVVAAAADYFFPTKVKGALSALTIGAIPIERNKVDRRSADLAAELIQDGWSVVIFPEGGRSPDGWTTTFRGGAAYLALRCSRPVVPVHLEGTRRVWKRGDKLPTPVERASGVRITFGSPMWPEKGSEGKDETSRRFAARIEAAVAALADEQRTDWWQARKRAAAKATPSLAGPEAGAWRRAWALESQGRSPASREWP
ncbi:MAG: 1-acyl-sn-glycerol-3-phosphate acyltransferase [Actinomycetota bacterium]|jgi:1-acyl-sn-glycerol-3-phosphate acyltransferase|nr:1-acyl-sn-glycerol-3-phosphate acyltransferase [Actinomycetota bacterium]